MHRFVLLQMVLYISIFHSIKTLYLVIVARL